MMKSSSTDLVSLLRNGINKVFESNPETAFFRVVDSSKVKSRMTREEQSKNIEITDITYREEVPRLYKTAKFLSAMLPTGNKTPRIIVLGKQCPDTVRATLAVLLAGGAVVELFPTKSKEQLLDESERSSAIFALVENKAFAESVNCPFLTFEELENQVLKSPYSSTLPDITVSPDSLALLLFTSGSTGKAKPVLKSHYAMASNVTFFSMSGLFSQGERVLSVLYLAHIYPAIAQFTQATLGLTTVLPGWRKNTNRLDPFAAPMCARFGDCHILVLVPSRFPKLRELISEAISEAKKQSPLSKKLLELAIASGEAQYCSDVRQYCIANNLPLPVSVRKTAENRLLVLCAPLLAPIRRKIIEKAFGSSVRVIATGGSHIDSDSMEFFEWLDLPVINGWGSTEAGILTFSHALSNRKALKIGLPVRLPSSVGYPPSSEIEFLVDATGILYVASPTLADGYEGMPEKTEEVFVTIHGKRYFNTEDVVKILDDVRSLAITGRSGRRFKDRSGEWVSPERAETELSGHSLVSSAFVWGEGFTTCVGILSLDFAAFENWAINHLLNLETQRDTALALAHQELLAYARQEVEPKITRDRVRFKNVILLLHPDSFEAKGLITDTQKIMSRAILDAYKETLLKVLET